ncbi:MAG: ABC transporter substrate-binding protein [Gammaproteobacteria bacterium]|nr:ABC transporter substrate-binding protein [Gammaproteobacteria bacterium]
MWNRQIWNIDLWAIPRHSDKREQALDFIKFATSTHSLARQARYIPYGPVRRSSLALIEADVRSRLPTARTNVEPTLKTDARW